jgi:hypothetical protein
MIRNTTEFADLPTWAAEYDGKAELLGFFS